MAALIVPVFMIEAVGDVDSRRTQTDPTTLDRTALALVFVPITLAAGLP